MDDQDTSQSPVSFVISSKSSKSPNCSDQSPHLQKGENSRTVGLDRDRINIKWDTMAEILLQD